jgi:hypothetical protein
MTVVFGGNFTNAVTHLGTANADTLGGDAGDDILLGGTSSLSGNVAALNAIMAAMFNALFVDFL